jgi:tellurite resistance protein
MTIRISSPSEAFVAVASIVIAADSVGSLAERDVVMARLKAISCLANQDEAALKSMLGQVTQHLCDCLPVSNSGAFTTAAVATIVAAVKPLLSAEQRGEALRLAEATVTADGASDTERALLDQLRAGLSG